MADEQIRLGLDLDEMVSSAKAASSALDQTKTSTTTFASALEKLTVDEIELAAETTALQAALDRLGNKQDESRRQTNAFAEALDQLEREEAQAAAEAQRLAAADEALRASLASVTAVAQAEQIALAHTQTAATGLGGAKFNLTQSTLQASFAFQDFTSVLSGGGGLGRAFMSVTNNIQQMLLPFGALGAGLSVAVVSAAALYQNWDSLAKLWGKEDTAKEAERMKELAKQTEEARKATEKLLATPSKEQKQPGTNIQKAIDQFGGPAVRKAIEDALVNAQGDFGAEANKQFTNNLVNNVMAGRQDATTFLNDILRGRAGPVNRVLRGEAAFDKGAATGLTPEELEQRRKAVEARNKQTEQIADEMGRDLDAERQRVIDRRNQNAVAASRSGAADLAARQKDASRQMGGVVREEIAARSEIARLQSNTQEALNMQSRGMATQEQAMGVLHQNQQLIAQLQQRLKRLEQQEAELNRRQTLLNRGR